ncbi:MAG: phosphoribosyltransferase [Gammaproteobacteria bacterium]
MTDKIYISANELLADSFTLAARIYDSGLRPDFIVGVWRGGTPVAIAVQEYLQYKNVTGDHFAIRALSYTGIDEQSATVRVDGLDYVVENINADNTLLIVDDVFDTGRSIQAVINELSQKAGGNMPKVMKTACPWYKPARNKTDIVPDFYLHETDAWLVFPHELLGLEVEEIIRGKPELAKILASLKD